MGKVIILTGIPGSGKSYFVNAYKQSHPYESCIICSADHHFEDLAKKKKAELLAAGDEKGANELKPYLFDYMQLRTAHMNCQQKFIKAMENDVDTIFVDNTNITRKERQFYVNAAMDHGYDIQIKAFPKDEESIKLAASRNQHGVPEDKIRQRAQAQDLFPGMYKITKDELNPDIYSEVQMLENIQFINPKLVSKPSLDDVSQDLAGIKEKIQSIKIEYPEDRTPEIAEALDDMTGALDVAQHHVEDIKGKLAEEA